MYSDSFLFSVTRLRELVNLVSGFFFVVETFDKWHLNYHQQHVNTTDHDAYSIWFVRLLRFRLGINSS